MIAGGGTGGHLFPAMAVAEEFLERDPEHRVLFVGTERGIEARVVPAAGHEFRAIRSVGIAGKGTAAKIKGLLTVPLSLADAWKVIASFRPQLALGVGGYVSGPALVAARIRRVPCAVQEQNAVPGWTNRILGLLAARVFITFENSTRWFGRAARKNRVVVSGNPVRKRIVDAIREKGASASPAPEGRVRVLVVGGSQGAHGLNLMVTRAMEELLPRLGDRISIIHQTGEKDLEEVKKRYEEMGAKTEVLPFIHDMAGAYSRADLVISRAGAGAVAEIALAGLPAIFVPFPYAASDHQAVNASALVDKGAALMFREGEAGPADLAKALAGLVDDPESRSRMAGMAKAAARPEAAAVIVDQCLELMEARPSQGA